MMRYWDRGKQAEMILILANKHLSPDRVKRRGGKMRLCYRKGERRGGNTDTDNS